MTAPVVVIDAANPVGRAVVEQALAVSRPVIAVTADPRARSRRAARGSAVKFTAGSGGPAGARRPVHAAGRHG